MDVIEHRVMETLADSCLDEHQREEFEAAKERGYLILDRVAKQGKLLKVYEYWCAFMNIPPVFLWDTTVQLRFMEAYRYYTYRGFTPHGVREMSKVLEKYRSASVQPEYMNVEGNVAVMTDVHWDDLEPLAREMLQKVLEPGIVDPPLDDEFSPPGLA